MEGEFVTQELDGVSGLPPEDGFVSTNFRAANTQVPIYIQTFQNKPSAWHAPMVRWPVGSDVALSGPLLSLINLSAALDGGAWDEPGDDTLKAYSSSFEALATVDRGEPLLKFSKITMTSAVDHFEPLLNIAPSSRTRKIQAANGDLEEKLDEANTLWAHTYPVPVRTGLHPFPEAPLPAQIVPGPRGAFRPRRRPLRAGQRCNQDSAHSISRAGIRSHA